MKWIAALIIFFLLVATASADDRRYLYGNPGVWDTRPDYIQLAQQRIDAQGYLRWCYVHESGRWIYPEVVQSLAEWFDGSEGSLAFYEDCNTGLGYTPDVYVYAASGAGYRFGTALHFGCPSGSVACLPQYGTNINIVVDAGATVTWANVRDIVGMMLHEFCHAHSDCGEMYDHLTGIGCKPPFVATMMSCGIGNSRVITLFDRDTFRIFHFVEASMTRCWIDNVPADSIAGLAPPCVGMSFATETQIVLWVCGRLDKRANTLSALYEGGNWLGSLVYPIVPDPANIYGQLLNASGCMNGIVVERVPGRCYYLTQTNFVSWNARKWSTLAGCA